MRILFVASECAPLVKTGGLADVVGALPQALATLGHEVRVLLPAYRGLAGKLSDATPAASYKALFGGKANVLAGKTAGLDLLLLDAPHLFDRPGNPYLGPDGRDWPDNHLRYGALCRVATDIATKGADGWRPDLVHCHDWQAGLVPAYLRGAKGPAIPSVISIHNVAFQGLFPAETLSALDIPAAMFTPEGLEYYGQVSMLKAGLVYADRLTTVSPTYARELMTPAFGMGMDGVLRGRAGDLSGILNGIDLDVWNPAADPHIAASYSARAISGKAKNKAALASAFEIAPCPDRPLFCVVSRMTAQKGLDLLLEALPALLERASLVLLGAGDTALEDAFMGARRRMPERLGVRIGYDEALSHLMQAGADAIVVPSRFEPCGLTQLYGLRYGTLPVVARTGGLADTVIDANDAAMRAGVATGFQFAPVTADALAQALATACDVFADAKAWRTMQRRAMAHPVGWDQSALAYDALYRDITGDTRGGNSA